MTTGIPRIHLAEDLEVSRLVTGLWQVADMERDGEALDARDVLKAGFKNGLTPRTQPWFRLTVADKHVAGAAAVKEWLEHVAERMLMVFGKSNLYSALDTLYDELGTFGTGVIVMEEIGRAHV